MPPSCLWILPHCENRTRYQAGGIRCLLREYYMYSILSSRGLRWRHSMPPSCLWDLPHCENRARYQAAGIRCLLRVFLCFVFWVLEDLDGGIRCLLPSIRKSRVPTHYLLCGNPSLPDGKCSSHSSCIFSDQRCCLRHVQEEVIVHWDCKSWSIGCLLCVRALVFVPITFVVFYLPTICADTKKVTL